jgi:hypothetical protein
VNERAVGGSEYGGRIWRIEGYSERVIDGIEI